MRILATLALVLLGCSGDDSGGASTDGTEGSTGTTGTGASTGTGTGTGTGSGSSSQTGMTTGTGSGSSGGVSCDLDPPEDMFTFSVRNIGTRDLLLTYGCGANIPIVLETASGTLGLGPESAQACGLTCESAHEGGSEDCSDCGPGEGAPLGPSTAVSIVWDRRVWESHFTPADCTPGRGAMCARGLLVDESAPTPGTLTVCEDPNSPVGFCSGTEMEVAFEISWADDGLAINVQ